ncbi:MAG: hypothetical protein Q8S18_12370 [Bacteroidales bacterium]|nr:hypothetical protein [Bacteroidales bacterium]
MTKTGHNLFLISLAFVVLITGIYLTVGGLAYYKVDLEERFFHVDHEQLKPSGMMGHGLGVVGTLLIMVGVFGYMARKRYGFMRRWGLLKHWLEFHIFLCTLGPMMVLFHTAFKFGGIVSISFWSMVAVFLSGIAGRFIYLQIPRSIEGRELSLNEVKSLRSEVNHGMRTAAGIRENLLKRLTDQMEAEKATRGRMGFVAGFFSDRKLITRLDRLMKENGLDKASRRNIRKLAASELSLNHRIARLNKMQQLFKYWHVAHLPFALVMLVIMVIHVVVTILFGFKWIF